MIEIGTGQLSWHARERVSDRYGTVGLWVDASPNSPATNDRVAFSEAATAALGKRGTLIAQIIETRKSEHIGDLFRGLEPIEPEVDEQIELGEGFLFVEEIDGQQYIGVRPGNGDEGEDDGTCWLDPAELYRCHQQTVVLFFAQDDGQ